MPAHNTHTQEKKSKGPAQKAGGKNMSKKDKRATENNWQNAEEYLQLLRHRVIVDGLTLVRCTRPLGDGRWEVQHMTGEMGRFPIAGCITINSSHKTHIEACITSGSYAVVNGGMITASLCAGHLARAEKLLNAVQALGIDPSPAPNTVPSEFTNRIIKEGRVVFKSNFFKDDEENEIEFEGEAEVEAKAEAEAMGGVVKEIVARAKAEAEAEAKAEAEAEAVSKFLAEEQEPEINMDDL
jgi:hypothetical protein